MTCHLGFHGFFLFVFFFYKKSRNNRNYCKIKTECCEMYKLADFCNLMKQTGINTKSITKELIAGKTCMKFAVAMAK